MPLKLPKIGDLFSAGIDKAASAIGKAFDDNFSNKEELAKVGVDLEKVKAAVIAEANRHIEQIGGQAIEIEKAYLADVANARALQVAALQQNDLFSKRFIYYLAAFVMVSSVAYGVMIMFVPIPEGNKRLVEQFADMYLLTGALMVLSFFFGAALKRGAETKGTKETTWGGN